MITEIREFEQNSISTTEGTRSEIHTFEINPFDTKTPWGLRDKLGIIPMLPLVVLRLALVIIAFLFASFSVVATSLFPANYKKNVLWPVRWCSRLLLFAFGFWWIKEEGLQEFASEDVGVICAAPHVSLLDVFLT